MKVLSLLLRNINLRQILQPVQHSLNESPELIAQELLISAICAPAYLPQ